VSKYSAYGLRIDMTVEGPDRSVIETASGSVITTVTEIPAIEGFPPRFLLNEEPGVTFIADGADVLKRAKEVFPTKYGVQPKARNA
jgi:hypothetical protein